MNGNDFDREVTFDIVEQIGTITAHSTGWSKELNLVSWNGAPPKYDIRDWAPDHKHMSRGITLNEKEMRLVVDLLRNRRKNVRNNYGGDDIETAGSVQAAGSGNVESASDAVSISDAEEEFLSENAEA